MYSLQIKHRIDPNADMINLEQLGNDVKSTSTSAATPAIDEKAQKMLAKFGWSPGEGLGKKNQARFLLIVQF